MPYPDLPANLIDFSEGNLSATDDKLGSLGVARQLADIVVELQTPCAIAVVGSWGSGKTTTLSFTEDQIKERYPGATVVWFRAWEYDSSRPLLAALISCLLRNPEVLAANQASGKDKAKQLLINAAKVSYKAVPGLKELDKKDVEALYLQLAGGLANDDPIVQLRKDLAECVKNFKAKSNFEIPLFIVVDDLDRCAPDHALQLLDSLHLHLDVPGVLFLVGLNPQTVSHALEARFGSSKLSGLEYIQRICALSVDVPTKIRLGKDLADLALKRLPPKISGECKAILHNAAEIADIGKIRAPRTLNRIFSACILARNELETVMTTGPDVEPTPKQAKLVLLVLRIGQPQIWEILGCDKNIASSWFQSIRDRGSRNDLSKTTDISVINQLSKHPVEEKFALLVYHSIKLMFP